ncbi:MAG: SMP-30/gluconolactonase/LRE family protein [Pseudomonadota bacterium]
MEIVPVSHHRCKLGEGPVWDVADQMLFWVDGLAPALFRHDPASGATDRWALPARTVGSLAVRANGGVVLAMEQGFYSFDLDSWTATTLSEPMAGQADVRLNDGKVDRMGRFLAGGMNRDYVGDTDPKGVLYRLDHDGGVTALLDGFICFNGPCFSPDGRTLYVTGRDTSVIEAFDYDQASGTLGEGRVLISGINPDGATVDADGYVWSAQWDDACLLRITPDGAIDTRIDVPDQTVTSVMFGGPDLDIIFVTTALLDDADSPIPDAGRTLAIHGSGYRGVAEHRFGG